MANTPDTFSILDKHIVILGASSGLGERTAIRCAESGAKVSLVARREDRLRDVAKACGEKNCNIYPADATDSKSLEGVFKAAYEKSGPVQGLVHSIGIAPLRPLPVINDKFIAEMMASNYATAVLGTRYAVSRGKMENYSGIVWYSSVQAEMAVGKGAAVYAGTKGAMVATARVLSCELAPKKIRLNVLNIGMIKTEIWNPDITPNEKQDYIAKRHLFGAGEIDDVANSAIFLLSPASKWITGTSINLDGGYTCQNM